MILHTYKFYIRRNKIDLVLNIDFSSYIISMFGLFVSTNSSLHWLLILHSLFISHLTICIFWFINPRYSSIFQNLAFKSTKFKWKNNNRTYFFLSRNNLFISCSLQQTIWRVKRVDDGNFCCNCGASWLSRHEF